MSRLRKLKRLEGTKETNTMTKTASPMMSLDNEILRSGDVIGISVRIVNWKPCYQVYIEYDTGNSSFYDGPDANSAFRMYSDLLTAFKGVARAEQFSKQLPAYYKQIEDFSSDPRSKGNGGYYHNLILKSPSFLGFPQ